MSILNNKNCFISGATGGLGVEISKSLVKNGCNLLLSSKSESKLKNLKKELLKINNNSNIDYVICDFSDLNNIELMAENVTNSDFNIDILINCAGVFPQGSIDSYSVDKITQTFNINILSNFILTKYFSKNMKKHQWGRIVNIGSSSSYNGFKDSSLYCSTKHALSGLSKSLDDELSNYSIRVFDIMPGSIKTEMSIHDTNQNIETFIEPEILANFISDIIKFDNNFKLSDIKIYRSKYE